MEPDIIIIWTPFFFQHSGPGCPLHSGEQFHLPAFLRSSHPLPELVPSTAAPPGKSASSRKHVFLSCQTELYLLINEVFTRGRWSLYATLFCQDPATSRTLTLISKTIQTLGSLAKSKSVSVLSCWAGIIFSCLMILVDFSLYVWHSSVSQGQFQRVLHGHILRLLQWAEICWRCEECECASHCSCTRCLAFL